MTCFQPSLRFFIIPWSIHVAQYTSVRIDVPPIVFVDDFDAEFLLRIGNFADSPVQRRSNSLGALSSVNRGERFKPPRGARHNNLLFGILRASEQPIHPFRSEVR